MAVTGLILESDIDLNQTFDTSRPRSLDIGDVRFNKKVSDLQQGHGGPMTATDRIRETDVDQSQLRVETFDIGRPPPSDVLDPLKIEDITRTNGKVSLRSCELRIED